MVKVIQKILQWHWRDRLTGCTSQLQLESNQENAAQLSTKQVQGRSMWCRSGPSHDIFSALLFFFLSSIHSFPSSSLSFWFSLFFSSVTFCPAGVSVLGVSLPSRLSLTIHPVSLCQWELWGVTVPLRCALLPLYLHLSVSLTYTIMQFHLTWPLLF